MVLNQPRAEFRPITLTLNSQEEAMTFVGIMDEFESKTTDGDASRKRNAMASDISNWFSNKVEL